MATLSSLATNRDVIVVGATEVVLTIASNTMEVVATEGSRILSMSNTVAAIVNGASYA